MKPVWPLFKQAFTAADGLQTISTYLLAWGKRMGCAGISTVIPNGVDTQAFMSRSTETERGEMKKRLGIQEGDVTLITTSRLVHKNGIDDVLQALTDLPKHVTFVICGIGPDEEKLRALTLRLNLQSRVRFAGQLSHHELPTALQVSDIFIRPSRSEGMGNSFIEAMVAGIPVIATQEGGINDFLYDEHRNPTQGTTGWAVNKDTPADIVRAVTDIMERPEKVEEVVHTARAMVLTQYDWDLIATHMNEFINSVLALKTPTP
jgi:glycosyltransferase involved in cell wall biosynthesis